jgi:hypothetical protein
MENGNTVANTGSTNGSSANGTADNSTGSATGSSNADNTNGSANTGGSNSDTGNTNGGSTDNGNSDNGSSTGDGSANNGNTGNDNTNGGSTDNGNGSSTGGNNSDNGNTGNGNGGGSADNGNSGDGFIPGPGNGADIPTETAKTGGWYGRTVVSATKDGKVYKHSTAGVFGELVDSDEAIDNHDIPSFGTSILKVVFPQDDGSSNGDFFSNYQGFDSGDKKSWEFQIKNDDHSIVDLANAPISIALPEVKKVSYKKVKGQIIYGEEVADNSKAAELTLIDVDNATSYTVDQLPTANLTMQGLHTRTFKWVLGAVEDDDYTADVAIVSNNANITADSTDISADGFDTESVKTAKAGGKFGLPPM